MRLMIVDDDDELREMLSFALEGEAESVISAGDANEALFLARQQMPDLVITDHRLGTGEVWGEDLAHRLRDISNNVFIVVYTGFDDPGWADAYVSKGSPDALAELRQLIAERRAAHPD